MLPEGLLKFSQSQGTIVPHYLDERDHPWLRLLTEEYLRFAGASRSELIKHIRGPLPFLCPSNKKAIAIYILNQIFRSEIRSPKPPRLLRQDLFQESAASSEEREVILTRVASRHGITNSELHDYLFSDLPNERRIISPQELPSPNELALRANCLLVQGFLARAGGVEITLEGNARPVIRQAKLGGLICQVNGDPKNVSVTVSGPYSLFRRTLVYGRALGAIVPILSWCHQFTIKAKCILRDKEFLLTVHAGDPIFPSKPPLQFDSLIEEKFARGFMRTSTDWDLIREPEPVAIGTTTIFPDFLLRHRMSPERTWLLEIVGFWTADYLKEKLERLRMANLSNFILCINETLNCSDEDLPKGALIVKFRKTVDPSAVLKIIERPISNDIQEVTSEPKPQNTNSDR